MNGSSHDPESLTSSTPPIRLPMSNASNWMRIDIFWLPGTRDDSPEGRTPTRAMTTPSIENVALRMSSPRVSSMIDVKSSSDIQIRTSCIRLSSKNATLACWSGALSGGATFVSTCGGPARRRSAMSRRPGGTPPPANPIAAPSSVRSCHRFPPPAQPRRAQVQDGKTRADPRRARFRAFPDGGLRSGTGPAGSGSESKRVVRNRRRPTRSRRIAAGGELLQVQLLQIELLLDLLERGVADRAVRPQREEALPLGRGGLRGRSRLRRRERAARVRSAGSERSLAASSASARRSCSSYRRRSSSATARPGPALRRERGPQRLDPGEAHLAVHRAVVLERSRRMSGRSVSPWTTSVPSTTPNAVKRIRSRYGNGALAVAAVGRRQRRGERHGAAHAAPADHRRAARGERHRRSRPGGRRRRAGGSATG